MIMVIEAHVAQGTEAAAFFSVNDLAPWCRKPPETPGTSVLLFMRTANNQLSYMSQFHSVEERSTCRW